MKTKNFLSKLFLLCMGMLLGVLIGVTSCKGQNYKHACPSLDKDTLYLLSDDEMSLLIYNVWCTTPAPDGCESVVFRFVDDVTPYRERYYANVTLVNQYDPQ